MNLPRIFSLLLPQFIVGLVSPSILADEVRVSTTAELLSAISEANAGDEIILADGTYNISSNVSCTADGTPEQPIVVRGDASGGALIRFDALEGFKVQRPYWIFENLEIEGVCESDSNCEHAFHIVGLANHTIVRGVVMHEFNAQIKGNGADVNGSREYPDDVLIENCEFYNSAPRNTSNPVTPIDVVGGRRWIVRANFIHDHAKGGGNGISYAAFLKGHSYDGIFERNLIVCEYLHTGQTRLGLSFGGGGSSPDSICEESDCSIEHVGGIMRNNIIANCPTDVCIYLNESQDTKIYNNTLYNCTGIDVRFASSNADVKNNILMGRIREREQGTVSLGTNLESLSADDFAAWFTDPANFDFTLLDGTTFVDLGENLAEVSDDFCANDRDDGLNDMGAVEYDGDGICDTTNITTDTDTDTGSDADTDSDADVDTDTEEDTETDRNTDTDDSCGCSTVGISPNSFLNLLLL
ncbi:MAG: PE-PGRS family protein [Proteobacteria bacterium]|nr:PE-PGRS family protein [Pseudomonadota bacterium]